MSKTKILVIEDEQTMRTMICFDLRQLGYQVDAASDGTVGYQKWLSNTPLFIEHAFNGVMITLHDITDIKKFANLIESESKRLETIIKDLLTIAKIDRLDYQLDLTPVSTQETFDDVSLILASKIKEKSLSYHQDILDATLMLDVDKFKQVIRNLISNAIHYTDQGSIKLRGHIKENNYVLTVEDTGIGI